MMGHMSRSTRQVERSTGQHLEDAEMHNVWTGTCIHLEVCIKYIRGADRDENMLKSQDTFFCDTANSTIFLSLWTVWPFLLINIHQTSCVLVMILIGVSFLWSFFDLHKSIYIFLEGETHKCYHCLLSHVSIISASDTVWEVTPEIFPNLWRLRKAH